ncbi:MAG: DUF493 domain-containing protein [Gammaproteobacteria bacterium]|nr:DUF493 domain-containing protein [Gammaproteobacteria bacterium]
MNDDKDISQESLIKFPCDFTIKVFGANTDEFEKTILAMIKKHLTHPDKHSLTARKSENSKYIALSITVYVDSKPQLDRIYQDLSSSPIVLMAL